MSVALTMEIWQEAHAKSDSNAHHDAMRMFYAVEENLLKESELSSSNEKMRVITAKLLRQVTAELRAYTQLMEGNYFAALGISSAASSSDIKKAYRKLAMKHHPDRAVAGGCPGADKLFPMIQNAYECLSDNAAKRKYRVTCSLNECMIKIRDAGKHSSSSSSSNENNSRKANSRGGGYPYTNNSSTAQGTKRAQSSDNRGYSNWKDQWYAQQVSADLGMTFSFEHPRVRGALFVSSTYIPCPAC